ncbi:gamma-butyrobetaine hydroxylase-like domain-containing protein [Bradyrhizobium sp.]|uniref:DUF971 domain-containing protein n=1 Tax=Bradyrhizobium sp. TaxID=376 RepID=UPI00273505F4|nr:gamma-butyrobetaine hydroxylase-like domain-containing protein [Bradyrhizobium sp.]MDP3692702.1 gamma-butyrobetaine hydroxylase-like domain-containing protein [Bradyrhizobium sp.]
MSQPAIASNPSTASAAAPMQVSISEDLAFLDLAMGDGSAIRLTAERLRTACKCAHCIRARIDGVFPERFDGIAIVQAAPVGGYAVNLAFSDGHARGIYPWTFLLGLGAA